MKAIWIIEMIEGVPPSGAVPSCHGPASLAWFEPGGLRLAAQSEAVTTVLLFLAAFMVLLILSIAVFTHIGNHREKQRASSLALVKRTTLNRAMFREVRSFSASDSLGHAAQTALGTLQNDFPIVDESRPVGFLSRSALFSALDRRGPDVPLRDVMQPPAPLAKPTETVSGALRRFHYTGEPFLWIVDNGAVVGLVTPEGLEEYMSVRAAESRNSKDASELSPLSEARTLKS